MLGRNYKFSPANFSPTSSHSGRFLTVKISPNKHPFSRFAVIIPSRYDKRAVYRNRLRRFIFNIIQKNFNFVPSGRDYLIIVHSSKIKNDLEQKNIKNDLKKLIFTK